MFGPNAKKQDDSVELVGLDVQFVSGVGKPATGESFLLYKSAAPKEEAECDKPEAESEEEETAEGEDPKAKKKGKKKPEEAAWVPPIATSESENGPETKKGVTARKEATKMSETQKELGPLQSVVRAMAQAVGLTIADEAMVEGVKHLEALATEKATGKAPKDDTGAKAPSYPANENKVVTPSNFTGQAPSDDKTNGGPIKSKADKMFEGAVTQQAETVQGSLAPSTGAIGGDIVQGTPLYKSQVDEWLAKLEAQAPNKAAVAAAKEVLATAFDAPQPEPQPEVITSAEVEALVLAGLEPVAKAVEEVIESIAALRAELETSKAAKSADDTRLAELTAKVDDILVTVEGMQTRAVTKSVERAPMMKSRVPAPSRPMRAESEEDRNWAGSAFDYAAQIG